MVPAMDTRVSLRRLEVFCLVVQVGSVTRAAEQLYIAQPAVSSQLRALEAWLGVKLFVRKGNRLVLTDAGTRAHEWAQETLTRSLEIQRELEGLAEGTLGGVIVTSSMALGTYLLPNALAELRADRPNAEITLHVAQPQDALHAVETGAADVAVVAWDAHDTATHFVVEHLADEPLALLAAPDGPPAADAISLAEVRDLPFVGVPREVVFHRNLLLQLRTRGLEELRPVIRLGHAESMKRVVRERGWVTFVPLYAAEDELRDGRLRRIEITDAELHEGIWLVHRRDKAFSPLQLAAIDALRAVVSDRARALAPG
jgi:DNA-binding transcriptional LysR family regulator